MLRAILLTGFLVSSLSGATEANINYNTLAAWDIWVDDKVADYDPANLFAEANGVISAYPHAEPLSLQPFGGLVTKRTYSRFVLELEYQWGPEKFAPRDEMVRDAGVCFHLHGEDRIWPNSVECQIQEGDTGDIWAIGSRVTAPISPVIRNHAAKGQPTTRGGGEKPRFARFHRSYDWEIPGWNHLKITVDGTTAEFVLNGKVVNTVLDMERWDADQEAFVPLDSGRILLQAEGAEISYRNISITPLP